MKACDVANHLSRSTTLARRTPCRVCFAATGGPPQRGRSSCVGCCCASASWVLDFWGLNESDERAGVQDAPRQAAVAARACTSTSSGSICQTFCCVALQCITSCKLVWRRLVSVLVAAASTPAQAGGRPRACLHPMSTRLSSTLEEPPESSCSTTGHTKNERWWCCGRRRRLSAHAPTTPQHPSRRRLSQHAASQAQQPSSRDSALLECSCKQQQLKDVSDSSSGFGCLSSGIGITHFPTPHTAAAACVRACCVHRKADRHYASFAAPIFLPRQPITHSSLFQSSTNSYCPFTAPALQETGTATTIVCEPGRAGASDCGHSTRI